MENARNTHTHVLQDTLNYEPYQPHPPPPTGGGGGGRRGEKRPQPPRRRQEEGKWRKGETDDTRQLQLTLSSSSRSVVNTVLC